MNEAIFPHPERWLDVPESSVIPNLPNIPPCSENHLPNERFVEILSSMACNLHHVITVFPYNLQINPHPNTEIALEKEVVSVLQYPSWTKYTFRPIINLPLPALNHILGVYSIHNDKPGNILIVIVQHDFHIQHSKGLVGIGSWTRS